MQLTWDLIVLATFGAFIIYGGLISRNRILGVLVNLYIAIAATVFAGDLVYDFASNFSLISANLTITEFGTKTLLMILITGLLTIKSELSDLDSGDSLSKLMGGIYGFLTAGLFLAALFGFMSYTELANLDSNFALIVTNFTAAFALVPALIMIGSSFMKRK
ncbi:MAG: hypothetical protein PHT36_02385 [Patescibacteria group bacterium]|nr:hypothetical protein [Patescibacteria group bacterium]